MTFLEVKNLSQSIGRKQILKNVSFSAQQEEIVVFLGPNGAGKTTLLKTIIGLYRIPKLEKHKETNIIKLNNEVINKWPVCKKVEKGLLYLPQNTSLFCQMTVEDNLMLVYEYLPLWKGKDLTAFKNDRDYWLEKTSLTGIFKQMVGTLSGGQKRKLEVVRSLLMKPKLIMLDEPFAGVDPKSIYELKKIFIDMATKSGIAIIISDHHVDQLLSIANVVYVIMQGEIVTHGGIQDILNNEDTKNSYLGSQFYDEMAKRFL
jgi:lipopolysaccharide export system ATP-binding protein